MNRYRKQFAWLLLLGAATTPAWAADRPLPPREAPLRMTLPPGFHATLFAGEPDVVQPIAFTFDDRGRVWVVECLSYPQWTDKKEGSDRVVILEDTDGNGSFDKRTIFWDKGANLSGIEFGFGGVWLCSTPNLLFVPDRNGDDRPDGEPEAVLDGWSLQAKHNVFNSLGWGPDGWLYGCNGITATSRIGKPGAPDGERVPFNCGVWRYHPTRRTFEVVAWGTTNPWGLDWDDYGQAFITNCVIEHLWHVVPGAHFKRMYGEDLNPNTYGLLGTCADHIHWAGGHWTSSRGGQGAHDAPGGGHAHSGAMIYLGDNWPEKYRNGVFTCNIHGNRVNHDTLQRKGSGYVAQHAPDVLLANDSWFRGIAIHHGPDGAVYVSDWTDTGECHNYVIADRSNGRIFKVMHGNPAPWKGDLSKLDDAALVKLQLHRNDWHVRHARRILQERAAAGKLAGGTHEELRRILDDNPDVTRKLRALWALHATEGLNETHHLALLGHDSEYVRAWSVQLGVESRPTERFQKMLEEMAARETSPFARLHLASALQRLPVERRWSIARGLGQHAEDASDSMLPLMLWYGVEPLPPADVTRALDLLQTTRIAFVREYLTRRLATLPGPAEERLRPLVDFLARVDDDGVRRDVLRGVQDALRGARRLPMPGGWSNAYTRLTASPDDEVRERALTLALVFDDERAFAALRKIVLDSTLAVAVRERALQALVHKQNPDVQPLLRDLLRDPRLRAAAMRGLAAFADQGTPALILGHYASFTDSEKADAVATLASRPAWAIALLEAVEKGAIARRDVSAFTVRQLAGLKNKQVNETVTRVWGTVRATKQERVEQVKRFKKLLTADSLRSADRTRGRLLFTQSCAACHRLFDEGQNVGPELTGSQRTSLDYILENVLDPSAVVAREYQVTVLELKSGRVLNGIVKQETDRAVVLRTQNEEVVVPKDDIEGRAASPVSMMPEGLFDKLAPEEVRDLVGYLSGPGQVPLPNRGK